MVENSSFPTNPAKSKWPKFSAARWISWLLGAALLSALLILVIDYSEEREFLHLAARVDTRWLLLAVLLQAATYLAQGEIWRSISRTTHSTLSFWTAYKLSLAKLFVDQALPSSGLSGTIVVARGLEARGMPRPVVVAGVLINTASFCASYAIGLLAVLLIEGNRINATIAVVSVIFIIVGVTLTILIPWLAGKKLPLNFSTRFRFAQNASIFLEEADERLARDPWLLAQSTVLQIITILLDAATMWVLIESLGGNASPTNVFAGFMFASLVRSAGIVPGGLGTFEATSVWTLHAAGVRLSVGLAGTLLFRGLSFYLPMIPGFWLSKRFVSE